jgi:hypothetical protein
VRLQPKLAKQYSLNIEEHHDEPFKPEFLAAVRRARLLLSFVPAVASSTHIQDTDVDLFGSTCSASRCNLDNFSEGLIEGGKMASIFESSKNSSDGSVNDQCGTSIGKPTTTLCNLILDFIASGPDPDKIRFVLIE